MRKPISALHHHSVKVNLGHDLNGQWERNEVEVVVSEPTALHMLESVPLRYRLKAHPWHFVLFICAISAAIGALFMPSCLLVVAVAWWILSMMPKPTAAAAVRAYALANYEFFKGMALYGLIIVTERRTQGIDISATSEIS